MKIAIISDIHANFQALEAILEDIKNNNCDKVFCLGDLALAGPEPQKVVDYIQKQDWTIIQGNTDKLISDYSDEVYQNVAKIFPVMANALADDVKILTLEQINYLRNLPPQKELNIENIKILLVHGSPRRNNEDILPNMPLDKIEEIIAETDADLIFCGHTHVPCGYQTNKKQTVVNVGSVGRPMTTEPKACYCIVNFENGEFTIEHRLINYDREKTAQIIKTRNFDGKETLAEMILHPTQRHA